MKRKKPKAGTLIVFEGIDESGKTTLSRNLTAELRRRGVATTWFSFPGGRPRTLGRLVHDLHHQRGPHKITSIGATSLQMLHVAAHIDAIESKIIASVLRGECVVLDRFWWSTFVYGKIAGADARALRLMISIEQLFWKDMLPSVVFLMERALSDTRNSSVLRERLSDEYRKLARREQKHYPVVSVRNDAKKFVVQSRIIEQMEDLGIFRRLVLS